MMNKIILTLFVCLLHFNVEAKSTYNYSNLLIQIPNNAIPLSQLTEQNYKEFNLNKDEFKKLINVYQKMKNDGTSEIIINKDNFLNMIIILLKILLFLNCKFTLVNAHH